MNKNSMLELKKSIVALGMVTIGATTLTGCGMKNDNEGYEKVMSVETVEDLEQTKIFEPYEHYISVRVDQSGYFAHDIKNNVINNIPDGYEVYTIYPYTGKYGYGSQTDGYEVWFVNNETVEVSLTTNSVTNEQGYYSFGTVVEKEKTK